MSFLEELFQKKICICNHSLEEHEGKCYALTFNGSIWIACDCQHIRIKSLVFRVEQDEIPNPIKRTNPKVAIKPKPNVFQWGGKKLLHSRS